MDLCWLIALLFNMLSRLVITFLPRSKHLLISWLQSPSAVILEPPKLKSDTVSTVSPWPIAHLKAETLLCQQRCVKSRLWFFQWSYMDVRVGLWRRLSAEELILLNCGIGEDPWESLGLQSWESLGLQGDPTSPFWRRSALGFPWKDWC